MALLAPVPIHEFAVSLWPLCWNCLSRSFKPPLRTLPAAPPARRPPNPPLSRSPRPPPLLSAPALVVPPPDGVPGLAGWADGCPPVKLLTALKASRPRIAIVMGDMPPLLALLGVRCPRGPFCIPLRTSSKPIFLISHRN